VTTSGNRQVRPPLTTRPVPPGGEWSDRAAGRCVPPPPRPVVVRLRYWRRAWRQTVADGWEQRSRRISRLDAVKADEPAPSAAERRANERRRAAEWLHSSLQVGCGARLGVLEALVGDGLLGGTSTDQARIAKVVLRASYVDYFADIYQQARDWWGDVLLATGAATAVTLSARALGDLPVWATILFALIQAAAFWLWWFSAPGAFQVMTRSESAHLADVGIVWALVGLILVVLTAVGGQAGWQPSLWLAVAAAVPAVGVSLLVWWVARLSWGAFGRPLLPPSARDAADPYARLVTRLVDTIEQLGALRVTAYDEAWLLTETLSSWRRDNGLRFFRVDAGDGADDDQAWERSVAEHLDTWEGTVRGQAPLGASTAKLDRIACLARAAAEADVGTRQTRWHVSSLLETDTEAVSRRATAVNVAQLRDTVEGYLGPWRPLFVKTGPSSSAQGKWKLVPADEALPPHGYPGPLWQVADQSVKLQLTGPSFEFDSLSWRLRGPQRLLSEAQATLRASRIASSDTAENVIGGYGPAVSRWLDECGTRLSVPSPATFETVEQRLVDGLSAACLGRWEYFDSETPDRRPAVARLRRWTPRVAAAVVLAAAGFWLFTDPAVQASLLLAALAALTGGTWSDVREQVVAATRGSPDQRDKGANPSPASGGPA
jgi:hypothetical protein